MSRGGSFGGGQSSLGYLFESDEKPSLPLRSKTKSAPLDLDGGKAKLPTSTTASPPLQENKPHDPSKNYPRAGRPSTKVQSVPGGSSSLGYLFGGK